MSEYSHEFMTWSEKIKVNHGSFGRSSDVKVGAWTRPPRIPESRGKYANPDEGEFLWLTKEDRDKDESIPSPQLWEKGSSPPTDEAYPMLGRPGNATRSQMIAKYRKEMLELVRDVPENAYELSLRDIVELPKMVKVEEEENESMKDKVVEKENNEDKKTKKKKKKNKKGRTMARSESLDTGLLLKMFVPATVGRRGSFGVSGTGSKVSPKPVAGDGEKGGLEKGSDDEWWKKKNTGESTRTSSTGSNSSTSSITSSSNNNNNNKGGRRRMSGCLPFLPIHKHKAKDT